jgi:hypothetical protein
MPLFFGLNHAKAALESDGRKRLKWTSVLRSRATVTGSSPNSMNDKTASFIHGFRQQLIYKMKLSTSLLLPTLLGTAIAASDSAKVYTFPASQRDSSTGTPSLSPEEARFVIAQRLGVSQYHDIHTATEDAIGYVNVFGNQQSTLLGHLNHDDDRSRLVVMVEGMTPKLEKLFAAQLDVAKPTFEISNPPSKSANGKLIKDMALQSSVVAIRTDCSILEAANPFNQECWPGTSNFVHFDVQQVRVNQSEALRCTNCVCRAGRPPMNYLR